MFNYCRTGFRRDNDRERGRGDSGRLQGGVQGDDFVAVFTIGDLFGNGGCKLGEGSWCALGAGVL